MGGVLAGEHQGGPGRAEHALSQRPRLAVATTQRSEHPAIALALMLGVWATLERPPPALLAALVVGDGVGGRSSTMHNSCRN
jgi:hypothetical protein